MTRGTRWLVTAMLLFVPVVLVVGGGAILVGSLLQAPRDRAALTAYANDPSCSAPIEAREVPPGACTVTTATIQTATGGSPTGASLRTQTASLPSLTLALADGSQQTVEIRSDAFFSRAYPGDSVRVELFEGIVTRIADGGASVETIANPEEKTAGDRYLPYIGGGMLALGIAMLAAGFSIRKRQQ